MPCGSRLPPGRPAAPRAAPPTATARRSARPKETAAAAASCGARTASTTRSRNDLRRLRPPRAGPAPSRFDRPHPSPAPASRARRRSGDCLPPLFLVACGGRRDRQGRRPAREARMKAYSGPAHHMWKGDAAPATTKRKRARVRFPDLGTCEGCGAARATDRHHVDGDTGNNARSNIRLICRRSNLGSFSYSYAPPRGHLVRSRARARRSRGGVGPEPGVPHEVRHSLREPPARCCSGPGDRGASSWCSRDGAVRDGGRSLWRGDRLLAADGSSVLRCLWPADAAEADPGSLRRWPRAPLPQMRGYQGGSSMNETAVGALFPFFPRGASAPGMTTFQPQQRHDERKEKAA